MARVNATTRHLTEFLPSAGTVNPSFIGSATVTHAPVVGALDFVAPFISSVTVAYAPSFRGAGFDPISENIIGNPGEFDNGFGQSYDDFTFTLEAVVLRFISFIASVTQVYAPSVPEVEAPFIASTTVVYTPSVPEVYASFVSSVSLVYVPTLAQPVTYEPDSGVLLLAADEPTVYPIQLFFADQTGQIVLQSAGAEVSHIQTLTSGVLTLNADVPAVLPLAPDSGVLRLAADQPRVAGVNRPPSGIIRVQGDQPQSVTPTKAPSGVLKLTADPPTVIPFQPTSGRITLVGVTPANIIPYQAPSGRVVLAGSSPPYTTPTSLSVSGVLALKASSPTIGHVNFILQQSGIIRLRSDVPVVIPLTEPAPNPPPLEGTGVRVAGTVG